MTDILQELSVARRLDAERREAEVPFAEMVRRANAAPAPRDFAAALATSHADRRARIIAELKKASPSEGLIREDFQPRELAKELEAAGAAALSVLCEPHRFLGGEEYLRAAREAVALPVLYKDFLTTRYQIAAARAAGADAVLLIAAVLEDRDLADLLGFAREFGMEALVETHDALEIERAVAADAQIIGVNCRNLRDFSCDVSLLEELVGSIPHLCLRVAESGMHTPEAIARARAAGADAFLVGTALMRAAAPGGKLKELAAACGGCEIGDRR
ncbi:MAG: indole-3-glycerol phosphate synthase TrpC [Kiritimatiellae bacterium]|nr:indole-3-glycerol phosphate synthase TrpC [Kiritimatiellia bacterium]